MRIHIPQRREWCTPLGLHWGYILVSVACKLSHDSYHPRSIWMRSPHIHCVFPWSGKPCSCLQKKHWERLVTCQECTASKAGSWAQSPLSQVSSLPKDMLFIAWPWEYFFINDREEDCHLADQKMDSESAIFISDIFKAMPMSCVGTRLTPVNYGFIWGLFLWVSAHFPAIRNKTRVHTVFQLYKCLLMCVICLLHVESGSM